MMSSQVAAAGEPTVEMSPALGNQGQGRGAEALVKEMAVVLSRDVPWETYSAAKLISGADLARIQVRRPLVAGCRGRRGGAVAKGVLRCTACVRACSCGLRGWPHAKHASPRAAVPFERYGWRRTHMSGRVVREGLRLGS
jgi:hypothetical protein